MTVRRRWLAVLVLAGIAWFPVLPVRAAPACRTDRLALAISEAAYPDNDAPLQEPRANAKAVAEVLKRLGFATTEAEDLTQDEMQSALSSLESKVTRDTEVFLFFSGFGIQSGGHTYLIPVDARIWSEQDVRTFGFNLDKILSDLAGRGARIRIAVVDAARRNPFERRFRLSGSAGLAPVASAPGVLAFYSTSPGAVFNEAGAGPSPFAGDLVKQLAEPGTKAEAAFRRTQRSVSHLSRTGQTPWVSSFLDVDVALDGSDCPDAPAPVAAASTPAAAPLQPAEPKPAAEPNRAPPAATADASAKPSDPASLPTPPRLNQPSPSPPAIGAPPTPVAPIEVAGPKPAPTPDRAPPAATADASVKPSDPASLPTPPRLNQPSPIPPPVATPAAPVAPIEVAEPKPAPTPDRASPVKTADASAKPSDPAIPTPPRSDLPSPSPPVVATPIAPVAPIGAAGPKPAVEPDQLPPSKAVDVPAGRPVTPPPNPTSATVDPVAPSRTAETKPAAEPEAPPLKQAAAAVASPPPVAPPPTLPPPAPATAPEEPSRSVQQKPSPAPPLKPADTPHSAAAAPKRPNGPAPTSGDDPVVDPVLLDEIQDRLYEQNLDPGFPGSAPMGEAIRTFERRMGLPLDGRPTSRLLQALRGAASLAPWGALAYSDGTKRWGMWWNASSRRLALASARGRCGAADCVGIGFYGHRCGAFAASASSWSIRERETQALARQAAIGDCSKHRSACQIVGAVCADGSERVP